jgi:glycosyltransferase involved in cell wall biosynthesis
MHSPTKRILYIYPHPSTFILKDVSILSTVFVVKPYLFDIKKKYKVPFEFIKQLFFLLFNLPKTNVIICHFAGYSSFLPALLGKLTNTPCFIIVAGNDAAKFMDFSYGNFTKGLLGYFTGKSIQYAKHILPVHESLVYQDYDYYDGGKPAQGYLKFWPKAQKVPFTPNYYGYDDEIFKLDTSLTRKSNSFITIGNLGDKYAFKRKGFDLIVELAKRRPELHFTFIGWDGVKKIELPDNIQLLPFMGQVEIVTQFNQHQFYFQLSIMEGFPNALAEAMLCGCIPIGSNVSGIPHIIENTGFILKKHNIDDLNVLVNLALNSIDLKERSLLSRNRITTLFSIENRRKVFVDIINQYTN